MLTEAQLLFKRQSETERSGLGRPQPESQTGSEANSPVYTSRPVLPPYEAVEARFRELWHSRHLTNNGPFVRELEARLSALFAGHQVILVSSGTVALQLIAVGLGLPGHKVVTTPFSFVASASSLVWQGVTPCFADIHPDRWCLDANSVASSITADTKALWETHIYGAPADVDGLADLGKIHNLPVVYDGAHAFGTVLRGKPLPCYGDVSMLSLHATKLFHTVEGGAIITANTELAERFRRLRDYGMTTDRHIVDVGINAKMSEFHAAVGLELLDLMPGLLTQKIRLAQRYNAAFDGLTTLRRPQLLDDTLINYAYYPIAFESEAVLQQVVSTLAKDNIHPKRYFYPLLSSLPYCGQSGLPVAEALAPRVLCLPLYPDLDPAVVDYIAEQVLACL